MTLCSLNCVDAKKFRFVPRVKIDGVFRREMADSIEFMRFQDIPGRLFFEKNDDTSFRFVIVR